ncbi:MAG: hypothetical protein HGA54_07430, partial [Actinobacteria bacterium]|nr:hypothetical protein [Actinomycetota bacterium]
DMVAALERDVPEYSEYVAEDAQVDFYYGDVTFGDVMAVTDYELNSSFNADSMRTSPVTLVSLSQFNALRALVGEPPLTLAGDEFIVWCDFGEMQDFFNAFLAQSGTLNINGTKMHASGGGIDTLAAETASFAMNTGTLILPDSAMPANKVLGYSNLNVMYNGSRDDVDTLFTESINQAYALDENNRDNPDGWPFTRSMTAVEAYGQAIGLSTVIAYLAIYIGFVLLITCAAILALQQLSEAADNIVRYSLLENIGADQSMINKALFVQIGIYFIFPLALAICHTLVALVVVADVVAVLGHIQIAMPLAMTVALAIVVYGGYFLMTYLASRSMIRPRLRSR